MADEQIWYGFCTYWTDDWGRLSTVAVQGTIAPKGWGKTARAIGDGEIPSCPECNSVGFQIDAEDWWEGVQRVEEDEPGYYKYIKEIKNTCRGKGTSIGDLWEERKKDAAS